VVSCRERKKVGMLFTHLKRIFRPDRLRQRGPNGAKRRIPFGRHRPKSEETGEAHPAPGARIHHMRRRGSASPRLQLPRAHIAIFRAPGTSTLSVDCSRLLCANSGRCLRRGERVKSGRSRMSANAALAPEDGRIKNISGAARFVKYGPA